MQIHFRPKTAGKKSKQVTEFGKHIRSRMRELGLNKLGTLAKLLAEKTGLEVPTEQSMISYALRGKRKLSPERVGFLSEILNLDPKELVRLNETILPIKESETSGPEIITLDDSEDITSLVIDLSKQERVTVADLVKGLLWLSVQHS